MQVKYYIGQLEEELLRYQWNIDVFDRSYLVDKLFMLAETVNREYVNRLGYVGELHSMFAINRDNSAGRIELIDDGDMAFVNYYVRIPSVLMGILGNVVREVVVNDGGVRYICNNIIPDEFYTKEYNIWTRSTKSYALIDESTLMIGRLTRNFLNAKYSSHKDDYILIRAIFKDQRELLPDGYTIDDVMDIDLKVGSSYKLMVLFKKDVFSTLALIDPTQQQQQQEEQQGEEGAGD